MERLTKQSAAVVVLECLVQSAGRLFDERFDSEPQISPADLKLLRDARDVQLERLRENLRYARKTANR
jgi:hypothetical protein